MTRMYARGFSLIEVLVALIIIGVGMLGIAKIQAMAYASTGTASSRSIAAIEAASLAASMRANRAYWSALTATVTISIVGAGVTPTGDATLGGTNDCSVTSGTTPCAPAQLAWADLNSWATNINTALPSVTALVTCPAPAVISTITQPVSCTIQMNWVERQMGINAQSSGTANAVATDFNPAANQYGYTLYVEP